MYSKGSVKHCQALQATLSEIQDPLMSCSKARSSQIIPGSNNFDLTRPMLAAAKYNQANLITANLVMVEALTPSLT